MKSRVFMPILLACITMFATSCYRVSPNAGTESVLVMQPAIFGSGGIDDSPVSTGSEWVAASTDHVDFVITPITVTEEFDNLMTKDNNPVTFSVYLKVQIRKGSTPDMCRNFGGNTWYPNNIQAPFRTLVRDKSSEYKMFELSSDRNILTKLHNELMKDITDYVQKLKLPVDILDVSIGAVTPSKEVLDETKNTAAQLQQKLTQDARAASEISRKQAEINKADADKAYQKEMGMSISEYLELRQLEIEKEKVELVKDKPNVQIIFGDRVQPTYNLHK